MDASWTGRLRRGAAVGAALWVGASATVGFSERAVQLVALAPVTLVPLALALATEDEGEGWVGALASGAVLATGPAALLAQTMQPGPMAALLAGAWLVSTALVALVGLARLRRRWSLRPVHELAIDLGLLYLPVGGVWLLASRAGVALLGFKEPIVTMTAAHFHYAGLAAPVVAGGLGRALAARGEAGSRLYGVSTTIVILGIPLVAAGIQLGRAVELPAAVVLVTGMLGCAALLARQGGRWLLGAGETGRRRLAGGLLAGAGGVLVFSMGLALLFAATGSATRGSAEPMIAYRDMAELHGTANALGFALPALLGLTLGAASARQARAAGEASA